MARESNALRKLIDEELIHQVPSPVTPRCIYDTHKTYLIDFGNYVDWIETKNKDIEVLLKETVFATFPVNFDDIWQSYEIKIDEIVDSYIACMGCKSSFHSSEPVYIQLNACPKCAYKFDGHDA